MHQITCGDSDLAATLDSAPGTTGLLIVSGGNEIRSGAHGGMAELARKIAENGFPVLRFDRRGIGDSSGPNAGFAGSRDDIAAAADFLCQKCPRVQKLAGFGNCDASTALALFQAELGLDGLCIANPWTIEQTGQEPDAPSPPSAAAIRARYWQRLKNPGTYADLLRGRINLAKLFSGLKKAAKKEEITPLALDLGEALANLEIPCELLIAEKDTTARAFMACWESARYARVTDKSNLALHSFDTASHGFADKESKAWLEKRLLEFLSKL
ncbi:exosortase A system-associated hydrolase 1 [Parasphingorhabdus marina DSM 22363]|uniref:Exosortase A system-associated hydrolase 1 n=2 Tax=Parasphingorhabdus marina TaxID=394732 RepID=A0A1N6F726_9SPHN|nr:exosortase A system-associated hydrolase 1 [Parasphingorhabdus marina DSM 22363]